MRKRDTSRRSTFFGATALCVAGLVGVILAFQVWVGGPPGGYESGWSWVMIVSTNVGFMLPFAAFAGGLAATASLKTRGVIIRAVVLSVLSYGLLAYASPVVEYQSRISRGDDLTVFHPFGPDTPGRMLERRDWVRANPPETYSFSVEHPLETPPNWLTHLIHLPVAFSFFAILAALIGRLVGLLTTGLSPPVRRNTRWALGLATSLAYFVPLAMAGDWVRLDPSNSAVAAIWLPLLVPLAEIALLLVLVRRREERLHAPEVASV